MRRIFSEQDQVKVNALARHYMNNVAALRKEIRHKRNWGRNTDFEEEALAIIEGKRNK